MKYLFTIVMLLNVFSIKSFGSIVYTNMEDTELDDNDRSDSESGKPFSIDLNGDNEIDFEFIDMEGNVEMLIPSITFKDAKTGLATVSSAQWDVLKGFEAGVKVNANTGWYGSVDAYIDPFWAPKQFPQKKDVYLAAKFEINNKQHYGWIMVHWITDQHLIFKSYAYESTPNTPILTGDTATKAPILVTEISIYSADNSDSLALGTTLKMMVKILPEKADDKSVSWKVNNLTGKASIANGVITPLEIGTIEIVATAKDGSNISGSKIITIYNPTSVSYLMPLLNFSIYPNPCNSYIKLSGLQKDAIIQLYTVSGQLVKVVQAQFEIMEIDITDLPKGQYVVKTKNNTGLSNSKMVHIIK